ncbi:hypothetical protein D3C85_1412660 [compost metagenome]
MPQIMAPHAASAPGALIVTSRCRLPYAGISVRTTSDSGMNGSKKYSNQFETIDPSNCRECS